MDFGFAAWAFIMRFTRYAGALSRVCEMCSRTLLFLPLTWCVCHKLILTTESAWLNLVIAVYTHVAFCTLWLSLCSVYDMFASELLRTLKKGLLNVVVELNQLP